MKYFLNSLWIFFSPSDNADVSINADYTKGTEKFSAQPKRDSKKNSDVWSDLRRGSGLGWELCIPSTI